MSLQINQNIIMTRKAIEAAIKPKFMAKLKNLRIKTKFMNNIMNPKWSDMSHKETYLNACLNTNYWGVFIIYSFDWRNSPEGSNFWNSISNK